MRSVDVNLRKSAAISMRQLKLMADRKSPRNRKPRHRASGLPSVFLQLPCAGVCNSQAMSMGSDGAF